MSEGQGATAAVAVAVVDLMVDVGYERMTTAMVAERAGVERSELERRFADLQDCVIQVYWRISGEFMDGLKRAYEGGQTWREGFRAAAYFAARYFQDNPRIIRFATVEMFGAGLMAQAQRTNQLQQLVDLVDAGRQELDDPDSVGRGVAEGVFGSLYEFLVKKVQEGAGTDDLERFVPDLMYLAVRPYLGQEAAGEELAIPPPPKETSVG